MSQPRDPDVIIATWLDDGPIDLPEETRRAITVGLRTQPRARQVAILRGLPVNPFYRFAAAAAIVLAVGGLSIFVLSNRNSGPGTQPGPTATTAPSALTPPSASPSPDPLNTATWTPFVSTRYGFSIAYPAGWRATPGDRDWTFTPDAAEYLSSAGEEFYNEPAPGSGVRVTAWSVAVPPGTTLVGWIELYCPKNTTPCTNIEQSAVPVVVDGHSGLLLSSDGDVQAFFLVDDRMYVVACWRPDDEPSVAKYSGSRRLVEAYLSTMRLLPGGPASASSSPAPS